MEKEQLRRYIRRISSPGFRVNSPPLKWVPKNGKKSNNKSVVSSNKSEASFQDVPDVRPSEAAASVEIQPEAIVVSQIVSTQIVSTTALSLEQIETLSRPSIQQAFTPLSQTLTSIPDTLAKELPAQISSLSLDPSKQQEVSSPLPDPRTLASLLGPFAGPEQQQPTAQQESDNPLLQQQVVPLLEIVTEPVPVLETFADPQPVSQSSPHTVTSLLESLVESQPPISNPLQSLWDTLVGAEKREESSDLAPLLEIVTEPQSTEGTSLHLASPLEQPVLSDSSERTDPETFASLFEGLGDPQQPIQPKSSSPKPQMPSLLEILTEPQELIQESRHESSPQTVASILETLSESQPLEPLSQTLPSISESPTEPRQQEQQTFGSLLNTRAEPQQSVQLSRDPTELEPLLQKEASSDLPEMRIGIPIYSSVPPYRTTRERSARLDPLVEEEEPLTPPIQHPLASLPLQRKVSAPLTSPSPQLEAHLSHDETNMARFEPQLTSPPHRAGVPRRPTPHPAHMAALLHHPTGATVPYYQQPQQYRRSLQTTPRSSETSNLDSSSKLGSIFEDFLKEEDSDALHREVTPPPVPPPREEMLEEDLECENAANQPTESDMGIEKTNLPSPPLPPNPPILSSRKGAFHPKSEDLMKPRNAEDGSLLEEFKPTRSWKTIRDDQVLPPGCHVRMNLDTGTKEARLVDGNTDE